MSYVNFVVVHEKTFYAEYKQGKYKKIKGKNDDEIVCSLEDADSVIRDYFEDYAILGQELYICDERKKRIAVYRLDDENSNSKEFSALIVTYGKIYQYKPLEIL